MGSRKASGTWTEAFGLEALEGGEGLVVYSVRDKLWNFGVEGIRRLLSSTISDISEDVSQQGVIPLSAGLEGKCKGSIQLVCD